MHRHPGTQTKTYTLSHSMTPTIPVSLDPVTGSHKTPTDTCTDIPVHRQRYTQSVTPTVPVSPDRVTGSHKTPTDTYTDIQVHRQRYTQSMTPTVPVSPDPVTGSHKTPTDTYTDIPVHKDIHRAWHPLFLSLQILWPVATKHQQTHTQTSRYTDKDIHRAWHPPFLSLQILQLQLLELNGVEVFVSLLFLLPLMDTQLFLQGWHLVLQHLTLLQEHSEFRVRFLTHSHAYQRLGNLVFYVQSTITVISGQSLGLCSRCK